jgi:hypothetical protein
MKATPEQEFHSVSGVFVSGRSLCAVLLCNNNFYIVSRTDGVCFESILK